MFKKLFNYFIYKLYNVSLIKTFFSLFKQKDLNIMRSGVFESGTIIVIILTTIGLSGMLYDYFYVTDIELYIYQHRELYIEYGLYGENPQKYEMGYQSLRLLNSLGKGVLRVCYVLCLGLVGTKIIILKYILKISDEQLLDFFGQNFFELYILYKLLTDTFFKEDIIERLSKNKDMSNKFVGISEGWPIPIKTMKEEMPDPVTKPVDMYKKLESLKREEEKISFVRDIFDAPNKPTKFDDDYVPMEDLNDNTPLNTNTDVITNSDLLQEMMLSRNYDTLFKSNLDLLITLLHDQHSGKFLLDETIFNFTYEELYEKLRMTPNYSNLIAQLISMPEYELDVFAKAFFLQKYGIPFTPAPSVIDTKYNMVLHMCKNPYVIKKHTKVLIAFLVRLKKGDKK